jgi:hypothetical protein
MPMLIEAPRETERTKPTSFPLTIVVSRSVCTRDIGIREVQLAFSIAQPIPRTRI